MKTIRFGIIYMLLMFYISLFAISFLLGSHTMMIFTIFSFLLSLFNISCFLFLDKNKTFQEYLKVNEDADATFKIIELRLIASSYPLLNILTIGMIFYTVYDCFYKKK